MSTIHNLSHPFTLSLWSHDDVPSPIKYKFRNQSGIKLLTMPLLVVYLLFTVYLIQTYMETFPCFSLMVATLVIINFKPGV